MIGIKDLNHVSGVLPQRLLAKELEQKKYELFISFYTLYLTRSFILCKGILLAGEVRILRNFGQNPKRIHLR